MAPKKDTRAVKDREQGSVRKQEASKGGPEHFCDDHSYVGGTPCPNCEESLPSALRNPQAPPELGIPEYRVWTRDGRGVWHTKLEAFPVVYTMRVWQESHHESGDWLVMVEGTYFADRFNIPYEPNATMVQVFAKAKSLVRLHLIELLKGLA